MQLLDKLQYLQMMVEGPQQVDPAEDQVERVLEYATGIWPALELRARKLKVSDIISVYQHGDRQFFHVKVFPRKSPDTQVIVITDAAGGFEGHILIDLAAEYAEPFLECPSADFEGLPQPADIEALIPSIDPDEDNPFAVLSVGDGTYLQTYRTAEGFLLEHQLVNTSSHYEIPDCASAVQVVSAMISYAFGNNEWLSAFDWRRQSLD